MSIDASTVIALISGLIGGTGITGLYEFHWRSKERRIQYFREMVFTQDFFDILKVHEEIYDLLRGYAAVKLIDIGLTTTLPATVLNADGEEVVIDRDSIKEVLEMAEQFGKKRISIVQKAMHSGVWYLLPKELLDIVSTFESIKIILREENLPSLPRRIHDYRAKIDHASEVVRVTLGLESSEPTV